MMARGVMPENGHLLRERPRRDRERSLGSNIRDLITGMELTRIEERRHTLENLRRITSLQILDPMVDGFRFEQDGDREARGRLERLVKEMEEEFERLLSAI